MIAAAPQDAAFLAFADFEPGAALGAFDFAVDDGLLARWRALFPHDRRGTEVPLGLVSVVIMRAYGAVVAPRPPGNLHVGQRITVNRPPRFGEPLRATVVCAEKHRRAARRVVSFRTEVATVDGEALFGGLSTIFWAA